MNALFLLILSIIFFIPPTSPYAGETVLLYDEDKGVIFADRDSIEAARQKRIQALQKRKSHQAAQEKVEQMKQSSVNPQRYFESGLDFFRAGDFKTAQQIFSLADSLDPSPVYQLWIGKTLRQQGNYASMLQIMRSILTEYPASSVADDALFETAFYFQVNHNYAQATEHYKRLSEQYPFGTSYTNGEEFREVAQRQYKYMRAEILSMFNVLGIDGTDLSSRYRQFQTKYDLPQTGQGDRVTILKIKEVYRLFLAQQQQPSHKLQILNKHTPHLLWVLLLLFVNCVILIVLIYKTNKRRNHLNSMTQSILELGTGIL